VLHVTQSVTIPNTKNDRLKRMFEEISDGMAVRRHEVKDWEKNENLAYKRPEAYNHDTPDQTAINKLGSWVEKRMASLAFRAPSVKLTPKRADAWEAVPFQLFDREGGPVYKQDPYTGMPAVDPMTGMPVPEMGLVPRYKVLEATQNQVISHPNFDFSGEIRRMIRSSLLYGLGVAKVGYTADFEHIEVEVEPIPVEDAAFLSPDDLQYYAFNEDGSPVISNGMLVPKDQIPIEEEYFFQWVPTHKMIFDPNGGNRFKDHKWVAMEYEVTVEELKKDKRLKNTKNLKATYTRGRGREESDAEWDAPPDEHRRKYNKHERTDAVKCIELWDFDKKKWYIIADGHDEFLLEEDFPEGTDPVTGPWVFLRPVERVDEWYGDAHATWLRTIAENYDKMNEQVLREGRKAARKILVTKDKFDGLNLEELIDPVDRVIALEAQTGELPGCAFSMEVGGVHASTLALKNDLNRDFTEVSGSPDSAHGIASADTATEVKALTAYDSMREDYQRGMVRAVLIDAMRKMKNCIKENMSLDQYVTVRGAEGQVMSGQVGYRDIQCDCDVDIDIADLTPLDEGKQRSDFVQAATIVSQAPWLVIDEEAAGAFFDLFGPIPPALVRGISMGAQMQMQMLAAQAQPEKPATGPAEDEADAISKQGGLQ
jgi:hypothetical protein